jgi:F-type H+-transporting ATPase subunit b
MQLENMSLASGFGLNTNIIETNLINLSAVITILVYFGGGIVDSVLVQRRNAIVASLEDAERRYADALSCLERAEEQLAEANALAVTVRSKGRATAQEGAAQILSLVVDDTARLEMNKKTLVRSEEAKVVSQVCLQAVTLAMRLAEKRVIQRLRENPTAHDKLVDQAMLSFPLQKTTVPV